ncbi:MAG: ribulose-phosphate 3-epimerase [Actinomycetota bacterium]
MGRLAPSVISADFTNLSASLLAVEPSSSSWHVDVMDGHYVPNLTIGPMVVEAIAKCSSLPQDVHVMISNVDETWEWYAKAGARRIAFHAEVSQDATKLADAMRSAGIGAGLALNPDVPVTDIEPYLDVIDHVIVMSVYPGFSGQKFIPSSLPKLAELRTLVDDRGLGIELYIDGGVSPSTAPACIEAGADVLISASAIFGAFDPSAVAAELAGIAAAR